MVRIHAGEPHIPALKIGRFLSPELLSYLLSGSNPRWAFRSCRCGQEDNFRVADHTDSMVRRIGPWNFVASSKDKQMSGSWLDSK